MKNLRLPNEGHLQKLLETKPFFAVIAEMENKLIGGLTFYGLDQYYSREPLAVNATNDTSDNKK